MKTILRITLPMLAIVLGVIGARVLIHQRPSVESISAKQPVRAVRIQVVRKKALVHEVIVYGTVVPRTETTLMAEVTGRIIEVSPSFVSGGFVREGQQLLRIDPSIYEANVAAARAELAGAEAVLSRELAEAEIASREWKKYGKGEASPLVLREPQLAEARAIVDAASAGLKRVLLDLDRTALRTPYEGRIRERFAEEGQYVTPGTPLVTVYAIDYAEVRLPISPAEVAYLDLPLGGAVRDREGSPAVTLVSRIGGVDYAWPAWISRTEGQVDPKTRTLYAVARVRRPYEPPQGSDAPPLLVGMFVKAIVTGRSVDEATTIPREAIEEDQVWVVDAESRIRHRRVEVIRLGDEDAWIGTGVEEGDRVCITPLDVAVEGMKVRVIEEEK